MLRHYQPRRHAATLPAQKLCCAITSPVGMLRTTSPVVVLRTTSPVGVLHTTSPVSVLRHYQPGRHGAPLQAQKACCATTFRHSSQTLPLTYLYFTVVWLMVRVGVGVSSTLYPSLLYVSSLSSNPKLSLNKIYLY